MSASRSLRRSSTSTFAADQDRAAPGEIGRTGCRRGRESRRRSGNPAPARSAISSSMVMSGLVDQRDDGVDHLAEIMRRNIGRHADGDAARAIDQKIGKARRQDDGLALLAVVIRLEIDRVGIDVLEQRQRRPREARFGVAHRRRRIAVDRTEIALPVDQRQAHREGLRHAHQRVIDRGVAMRVIFTHHVADDAGAISRKAGPACDCSRSSRSRMRRCTGFSPSRTSGSARLTITLIA